MHLKIAMEMMFQHSNLAVYSWVCSQFIQQHYSIFYVECPLGHILVASFQALMFGGPKSQTEL